VADECGVARVRVAGGENWDSFVRWSLAAGFCGLENLILIPGTVGAAPIQNIGAYGAELSEFVDAVEAWDRNAESFVRLDHAACAFTYRDSVFKRNPHRYLVTAVEFLLPRKRPLRLDYAGIREELRALGVAAPTPATVGQAVERLRRRKLPDPAKIGNAGSFFKNPIIARDRLDALRDAYPNLPAYPHGESQRKLSAAWLIEACGLKGAREGAAGVSEQHALVLVNHGGATGAEIWALATRIRETVAARFGVNLEPEPVIL
jgi:UDP-N-acetylmuramate dehydrogenase